MSNEPGPLGGASGPATTKAKPRTRYKHSDYVCEKCRRAHRRCKHDPALDPNYDPNKSRKRKRIEDSRDAHEVAQSSIASLPSTSSVLEPAQLRRDLTTDRFGKQNPSLDAPCPVPPHASELQHPLSARHLEMLTFLLQAFSICSFVELPSMQWRSMLRDSAALRTAVLSLIILLSPDAADRYDEAIQYKQMAVTLQLSEPGYDCDYYTHCTPLFIGLMLCLCEFASQSPLELLAFHATQSRFLLDGYLSQSALSSIFTRMIMPSQEDGWPISEKLLKTCPSVAAPFFSIFPGVDFRQNWAIGSIQDLLSLTLTGYALALQLPSVHNHAVRELLFRLCLHVVQRNPQPPAQQRFADLMVETLYVLLTWLERSDMPLPNHLRMSLCAKIELVEHFFGAMTMPRAIVDLLDGREIDTPSLAIVV